MHICFYVCSTAKLLVNFFAVWLLLFLQPEHAQWEAYYLMIREDLRRNSPLSSYQLDMNEYKTPECMLPVMPEDDLLCKIIKLLMEYKFIAI